MGSQVEERRAAEPAARILPASHQQRPPIHQAPDALDGVEFVSGVGRQPEQVRPRMGQHPAGHDLSGVNGGIIEHEIERAAGIGGEQLVEEGNEMDGELARMVRPVPLPAERRQRAEEGDGGRSGQEWVRGPVVLSSTAPAPPAADADPTRPGRAGGPDPPVLYSRRSRWPPIWLVPLGQDVEPRREPAGAVPSASRSGASTAARC